MGIFLEIEKFLEYYYFFFIVNNLSIIYKFMRIKFNIKFYILFVYLIIIKFFFVFEERLILVLVIVNYSKEINGCVNYRFFEIYLIFKNVENFNENCVLI